MTCFFSSGREEAAKAAKATDKNLSKKASIPGGTAGPRDDGAIVVMKL